MSVILVVIILTPSHYKVNKNITFSYASITFSYVFNIFSQICILIQKKKHVTSDVFIIKCHVLILHFYSATSFILKDILPILSFPSQTTFTTSPSVSTSSTRLILSFEILEMCTIPSFPGANSTNAPNSLMLTTFPSRTCPASKSVTMI